MNLKITCPEEPVKRKGLHMFAQEITAGVELITPDGEILSGTVVFPEVEVDRYSMGEFMVRPCVAQGEINWGPKPK